MLQIHGKNDSLAPLNVIDWPRCGYITLDHRRIYALREHQRNNDNFVQVRARAFTLPAASK